MEHVAGDFLFVRQHRDKQSLSSFTDRQQPRELFSRAGIIIRQLKKPTIMYASE